jgi:hypothetical protein
MQQLGEQDDCIAVWAEAAHAHGAGEGIAVRAALLSHTARLARGAFVHGVFGELPASLQIRVHGHEVCLGRWVMAQSVRLLLAGARAVAGAARAQWYATDQAGWLVNGRA